jgi:predicted aspartyl protease
VDTGALMMLLPEDEVRKLGLRRGGRVIATDANDHPEELPTAQGLEVSLLGRSMVTDCVIGPLLCEPLIGQLVLEELDLVVDCARNTLGPRPESPNLPLLKLK